MVDGVATDLAGATDFSRSTVSYARDLAGTVSQFSINALARTDKGALVQPALTRLNANPVDPNNWTALGGVSKTLLSPDGLFNVTRITSGGTLSGTLYQGGITLTSGVTYSVLHRYKAGTSGNFQTILSTTAGGVTTSLSGAVGAVTPSSEAAGVVTNRVDRDLGGGLWELAFKFTPNTTQTDWRLRAGMYSAMAGQYVDFYGGQIVSGASLIAEWVIGTTPQGADVLTLKLPDDSGQEVVLVDAAGGQYHEYDFAGGDYTVDPTDMVSSPYYTIALARPTPFGFWGDGDSYMRGNGVTLPLVDDTNPVNVNTGVGGSMLSEVRDRVAANVAYADTHTVVIWDGSNNNYVSTAAYLALFLEIRDLVATRYNKKLIIIPPIVRAEGLNNAAAETTWSDLQANFPADNLLNWRDYLIMDGANVDPSELKEDALHLTEEAMAKIRVALIAQAQAQFWLV